MASWKLTTESPKESGEYVIVTRMNTVNGFWYGKPRIMDYSRTHDAWNCTDSGDGKYIISDLRNAPDGLYDSYIFAWMENEPLSPEEIAELEKGVA